MASLSAPPAAPDQAVDAPREVTSRIFPSLKLHEWILFLLLACVLAATNIYTTLLIGWSDTGAIISALLSMLVLGAVSKHKPSIFTINIGQSTASGGGAVGFAVGTYACVHIVQPDFAPPWYLLIPLFAAMGTFGALVAATVRPMMVKFFFPTGTACAVIQRTVTREIAPGEENRPMKLLKIWGAIASLATIPTKIRIPASAESALLGPQKLWGEGLKEISIGTDPLFYGIGLVVGPRIGLGMLIGGLLGPLMLAPWLELHQDPTSYVEWKRWMAIAVLTLPTFATIALAYVFHTPSPTPPGFTPGRTRYVLPPGARRLWMIVTLVSAAAVALLALQIFDLPIYASIVTMIVAWPMCVVNGRVNGDTDINPVRLVAVVLLATLTWIITPAHVAASGDVTGQVMGGVSAITLLGMAVIGGTMASVAVDMFQEYRTGHLLDADPVPMLSMQVLGAIAGSIVAIPVLAILIGQLGIGPESKLPAPGAQIWASMGQAMAGGFHPSQLMIHSILIVSGVGCVYAFLTVWPVTGAWMPSLFGIGIGMLLPIDNSLGIFGGGLLHLIVARLMVKGRTPEERAASSSAVRNDMMLAGSAVFAAAAVVSIVIVLIYTALDHFGLHPFGIA
jgi:uncharacterized oligopeptide transporter (OPT) family protein